MRNPIMFHGRGRGRGRGWGRDRDHVSCSQHLEWVSVKRGVGAGANILNILTSVGINRETDLPGGYPYI